MFKQLFPLTLFTLIATTVFAQRPTPANFSTKPNQPEGVACAPGLGNEAGTIQLGPFIGSSNDVDLDTMYLCFNDQVSIDHNAGSESLVGDPILATPAGIGYAFYDCPPSGANNGDIASIEADPCITNFPPPTGPVNLYVFPGFDLSGDVTFINTGALQTFFGGGAPILKWFAPITFDQLDLSNPAVPTAVYEGTPAGPCVDVNEQEAFAVVYLNEIVPSNIQTSLTQGGVTSTCQGSFVVEGGLPEFDSNETYSVSISLSSDPNNTGIVTNGSPFHGDAVEFQIVTPGVYDVVISDGKSCPASFQIDMSGCNAVTMNVPDVTGPPGTEVCLPITVENFTNILSFQYSINWDNTLLQFSDTNFVAISPPDINVSNDNDSLVISFFDLSLTPQTLPDGTVLFEICFTILAPVGTSTPVIITGMPTIIDVADGNGAYMGLVVNNGSVTAANVTNLNLTVTGTDVSCNGLTDGTITVEIDNPGGGVGPYTINWTNTTLGTSGNFLPMNDGESQTVNSLAPGDYTLVITDSSIPANSDIEMITIANPPILGANLTFVEPTCNGGTDGVLTAVVSVGGVPVSDVTGYTFNWNPASGNTQVINNYVPGQSYSVTVTDPNGCEVLASGSGTAPAPLDVDFVSTDASCSGINDGSATATASGGVLGTSYAYVWSTVPTQTGPMATSLGIGTYTVTVTDDNNCTYEESISISAATIIHPNGVAQDITCNGADNGVISVNPTVTGVNNGGYTYAWSPNVSTSSAATGLMPGTYTVTITDANGCNVDSTFVINEPDPIVITFEEITDETCILGNDGTATISVTGGTITTDYDYTWDCCPGVNAPMATGIPAGTYAVFVIDDNGCNQFAAFTIDPPTPPTIVSFDSVSVLCPNDMNGELTVNAVEGNAPIASYDWSNGNSGQTITGLAPGTYTVTVTSTDGCTAVDSAFLWAPDELMLVSPQPMNPSCFGLSDGTAAVQLSGGTMPYQYQWSANANNSTSSVVPLLPSGTYTVTVVDANNCGQVVAEVTLTDPPEISVVFQNINPVSCFGSPDCDGEATALASGGNAPSGIYTFLWSSGETSMGVSGTAVALCQGDQSVTVIDENNCSTTADVLIPTPDSLEIIPDPTQPTCFGFSDGSITVSGQGGTPSYGFDWGGGNTSNVNSNIPTGVYSVTITDFNGCTEELAITLDEPLPFVALIDSSNTSGVTCNGDNDGQISVTATGGNGGPLSYNWAGSIADPNSPIASDLSPGTYQVTISDVLGCTDVAQYTVTEPLPIFAQIPTPEEPQCFGFQTFMTVDSAWGGISGPYEFSIDNGPPQGIGTPIPVFAGTHTVMVFDSAGCSFEDMITIDQPAEVIVDLGADQEIQLGESYDLNALLGGSIIPIDFIIWTPTDSLSCIDCLDPTASPIESTLYTIEVFNVDGCSGTDDILIEVDKNRNVYIPNAFTPNGDGFNDYFQVFAGPGVRNINFISIYDRWGEKVWETTELSPTPYPDSANGWDGRMNGRVMNPAVFVYLIEVEFDDGVTLLYRGDVTLLH